MQPRKYNWNETLKFSWGHIVAFVALIFISYIAFMGAFYKSGGDFPIAGLSVAVIDIALLATFIGAQIVKGADKKFGRSIVIERILVGLTPVAFILAMIPYNHFWGVYEQREAAEELFSRSITGAKKMFTDYEDYAAQRISSYRATMEQPDAVPSMPKDVKEMKSNIKRDASISFKSDRNKKGSVLSGEPRQPDTKVARGSVPTAQRTLDPTTRENYVRTLELQLLSSNTDSLKRTAYEWIDNSSQGASVWNAFLIGNIQQIEEAIRSWHATLSDNSMAHLSYEADASGFDQSGAAIEEAIGGLHDLNALYEEGKGLSLLTIVSGAFLFLMLLFPYCLQSRNLKANGIYGLIPTGKAPSFTMPDRPRQKKTHKPEPNNRKQTNDPYSGTF